MAELVRNPKAMRRATAEVRGAFGARGAVAEHALGELRYLHLVIRETFRLHTPLPLLLPRQCQEPRRVLGYDVPRRHRDGERLRGPQRTELARDPLESTWPPRSASPQGGRPTSLYAPSCAY